MEFSDTSTLSFNSLVTQNSDKMPKYETRIKATYYVSCVCLYVLARYFGLVTNNPSSLIGTIIMSWLTSLPFAICVTTFLRRSHSAFNDIPGPQVGENTKILPQFLVEANSYSLPIGSTTTCSISLTSL